MDPHVGAGDAGGLAGIVAVGSCENGDAAAAEACGAAEKNELSCDDDPIPATDCTTGPLNIEGNAGSAAAGCWAGGDVNGDATVQNGDMFPPGDAPGAGSATSENGLDAVKAEAVTNGLAAAGCPAAGPGLEGVGGAAKSGFCGVPPDSAGA